MTSEKQDLILVKMGNISAIDSNLREFLLPSKYKYIDDMGNISANDSNLREFLLPSKYKYIDDMCYNNHNGKALGWIFDF